MTIDLTDNAPRISYTVSTSTTSFAVPFEFFDDADLVVVVGGTTKTLTTHYTVSGGDGATGTVTMTSGNAVSSGTVIIFRDIDFKRSTDFPTSGAFPIATLNTELDRNIALFDDLQDRIDRSVRLNDNDDAASMVLPLKASRVGTVLGFNATTGAAEAGPTIANVNSLADITTNINTVAGIASNVTTVAGIDANVSTVAGISSNVSTVAGIQSNVSSVAGNATNINTVAGSIANVNTVATNIADVNAVAADLAETVSEIETVAADLQETQSEIDTVATNIANVNTVGNAITNVNTTATNISNINTLAGISSNVSTVAGINSDVTTVAGISSNVTAVAGDATDIGTVATNIANVNTVGGISGNVTTVAGISGNVSTVAGISSNVSTVAGIDTDVSTVAGISSNVTSVANDASDIGTVASAISNVNTVAGNTTNINTVAGNNSNISTVGGISSNVTTVAGIASNVTTVAGISSDVTTVANDATDIGTVSTNISNVNTLANALSGTNAYTVTVVNSGGNKFALNGATNPTLTLKRGITYTFDQSDNTNANHPLAFKDGSGNAYTSGVTVTGTAGQAGAKVVFAVPSNAPSSLLYYCTVHGNAMGNTISVQDDNVAIVAGISSDITSVAGVASNVTTVAGIASNVTTVASNVSGINDFADRYRVASSAPSSNNDEGDLYYNTTSDQLFVYNGSAWISAALDASSALVPSNNLSDVASASTARTNLGLGTIATQSSVDSNIDTHLNTSTASSSEFLQWSGSDYQWSAVDLSAYLTSSTASSTYAPLSNPSFTGTVSATEFHTPSDFKIKESSSNFLIENSSGDDLISAGHANIPSGIPTHVKLFVDSNKEVFNTETTLNSHPKGVRIYDPDTNGGSIYLKNRSTVRPQIEHTGSLLKLSAGGTQAPDLTLNGSNLATFGANVADYTVKIGSSGYAGIYVDGDSDIAILNPAGDNVIFGANNSRTYLYYNSLSTLYTDANGIYVRSSTNYSDATIYLGTNGNARIINDEDSYFQILSGSGDTVIFQYNNAAVYLYHNGTQVIETHSSGIYVKSTTTNTDGTVFLGNQGVAQITGDHDNAVYIYTGSGDTVIWGSNNSHTYLYYDGSMKFKTTSGGVEVNGNQVMPNGSPIYWGSTSSLGKISAYSNGDMVIQSYDDMYLSSNWIRMFDGSSGNPGTNEYARISRTGAWFTGPIGFGGNNSGTMNTNGGSYGTSGQVLTSQGNATAPTWVDAGGGGAWELQSTTTLSGTGSSSYYRHFTLSNDVWHRFTFDNFWWYVSGDYLGALFSRDGGSNYDGINYTYFYGSGWSASPYQYASSGTGTTLPRFIRDQTNAFQNANMIIYVYAPAASTFQGYTSNGMATLYGEVTHLISGRPRRHTFKASNNSSSSAVNYIRFQPFVHTGSQGMNGTLRHETLTGT